MSEEVKSEILTDEQIDAIVNGTEDTEKEIVLPSEEGKEVTDTKDQEVIPESIVEEFTRRFQEKGSLDEKDYKELAAKGYSKEFVDTYIQGVQAKEMKVFEDALAVYNTNINEVESAVQWASENWDVAQIEQFNETVASTDDPKVQAFLASSLIREMKLYQANSNKGGEDNKKGTPIHTNKVVASVKNEGYSTKSDYLKDASDPRYSSDPAYRAKVESKLLATDTKQWYVGITKGD